MRNEYTPSCPVCGSETADTFYRTFDRRIVGCSECLEAVDSVTLEEEQEEADFNDWVDNLVLSAREEGYLNGAKRG